MRHRENSDGELELVGDAVPATDETFDAEDERFLDWFFHRTLRGQHGDAPDMVLEIETEAPCKR